MSRFSDYVAQLRAGGDARPAGQIALSIGLSLSDSDLDSSLRDDPEFAKEFDYASRHLAPGGTGPELGRAFSSGIDQLEAGVAQFPNIVGRAIVGGAIPENNALDRFAARKREQAIVDRGHVTVPKLEDARTLGDAALNIGAGVAQNLPSMAPAVVAGAGTALLTKNPTLTQAAAAAFIPSLVQNAGDTYQGLIDAGVDPNSAATPALLGGAAQGALDVPGVLIGLGPVLRNIGIRTGIKPSVLQSRLIGNLTRNPLGRRVLDGMANGTLGMAAEGIPEMLQEEIGMTVEEIVTGKPISDEERHSRWLNAGVQGAAMGGAMGGASGVIGNETNSLIGRGQKLQAAHRVAIDQAAQAEAQAKQVLAERQAQAEQAKIVLAEEARRASIDALGAAWDVADEIAGEYETGQRRQSNAARAEQRQVIAQGDLMRQMQEMSTLDPEDEARLAARVAPVLEPAPIADVQAEQAAAAQAEPISPPTPAASNINPEVLNGLQEEVQGQAQGLLTQPAVAPQSEPEAPAVAPVAQPVASRPALIVTPPEKRTPIVGRIQASNPFDASEVVRTIHENAGVKAKDAGGLAIVLKNEAGEHIVRPVDPEGHVANVSSSKKKVNGTATGRYAAKLDKLTESGWRVVNYLQVQAGKKFADNYAPGEYERAIGSIAEVNPQVETAAVERTDVPIEEAGDVITPGADQIAAAADDASLAEPLRKYVALLQKKPTKLTQAAAEVQAEKISKSIGRPAPGLEEAKTMLARMEATANAEPAAAIEEAPAAQSVPSSTPLDAPAISEVTKAEVTKRRTALQDWFAGSIEKAKQGGPTTLKAFHDEYVKRLTSDTIYQAKALGVKGLTDAAVRRSAELDARVSLKLFGVDVKSLQRSYRKNGSFRVDENMARTEMLRALALLKAQGFDIALFQQNLASDLETIRNTGGAVLVQDKVVAITVANLANPQAADIGSAFHEAAHPFLETLPKELYQDFQTAVGALTDAFANSQISTDLRILVSLDPAKLTDEQRSILRTAPAEQLAAAKNAALDPEEMALEMATEYLAIRGFDAGASRSLLRQIIDAVKELAYRVAYAMAKAVRGDSPVAQILAREYVAAMFRNAITRANEGTVRHQVLEWFGMSPWHKEQRMDLISNLDGEVHPGFIDMQTGQVFRNYESTETADRMVENLRIAEANEKIMRSLRETPRKDLPPGAMISVQAPLTVDGEPVPGYVQVDFVENGVNTRSTNQLQLAMEGYHMPDFSKLPRGQYTVEQAVQALSRFANDPRDREFLGQMAEVKVLRDKDGNLLAPNGKASKLNEYQWKQVRTANFKQWFGDWQNDPKNASKVVDAETGEPMVGYQIGPTFYTTDSAKASSVATDSGAPMIPLFIVSRNASDLQGIVVEDRRMVKSATANIGTFDPQQPSILRSYRVRATNTESPLATAHWQIASANFQRRTYESLYGWTKASLPAGMDLDTFQKEILGLRKNEMPTAKAAGIKAEMDNSVDPITGAKGAPADLDGTMTMDRLTTDAQRDLMAASALRDLQSAQSRMVELQYRDQKKYDALEKRRAKQALSPTEQRAFDELGSTLAIRKKVLSDQSGGIHSHMAVPEMLLGATRSGVEKFAFVHDATYLVPETADAKVEDLLQGEKQLKAIGAGGKQASNEEIIDYCRDIEKVAAWVNNPENQKLGAIYNQMRQQYEAMVMLNYNERIKRPRALIRSWWGKAIPESLRNIGLASARRIAPRFFKFDQLQRQYQGHCDVLGHEWLLAQRAAKKALGIGVLGDEVFQNNYMTPALRVLNDPLVGDVKERLFASLDKHGLKIKDSARDAFWKFIQKYKEVNSFIVDGHNAMGLTVKDQVLNVERRLIERGPVTATRRIRSLVLEMFANMETTPWAAMKAGAPQGIDKLYTASRDEAVKRLGSLMTPEVVEDFIQPLAMDSRAHFSFWSDAEGRMVDASVFHIRNAFAAATKGNAFDVVTFAEELHRMQGGDPKGAGMTVQAVVNSLAKRYRKLSDISAKISEANGESGVGSLHRQLMDARDAEDFPAGWVEFMPLDPSSLRQLFTQMATAAAFGRDGLSASGETTLEVNALRTDLKSLKYEYAKIKEAKGTNKAIFDEYKRRYGGDAAAVYQAAKGAENSLGYLTQFNKMVSVMVRERGTMADLNTPDRILSTIAAWTIAAPRTAIVTLLDAVAPFHFYKFSKATLRNIGYQTGKTMGSDFLMSSFRDLGMNLSLNADASLRRVEWTGGDPALAISARSRSLDFGMGSEQQKAAYMSRYVLRQMTEPLEIGLGDARAPKKFGTMETAAPKLRFLSLFRFCQGTATNTVIDSMYETTSRMYRGSIDLIENSGDVDGMLRKLRTGFDSNGKPFELTAKDLGMQYDDAPFAYLKEALASKLRRGTFERQVAEAYERYTRGKPIAEKMQAAGAKMEDIHAALRKANALLVDDETYAGIANVATEEMALEPGIGADSPLFSHPVMRPLMPLLSFSIKAAQRFPKMFKDPAGQMSARTVIEGALTLALVAVPITLGFSMVMDRFDEDVLDKKNDLRDPDTAMGALERLARYGVGGAYSEVISGVLNAQQGMRPFEPSSRIMAFAKFNQVMNLTGNLILANPPLDWANFGRPVTQLVGANNLLQYTQIANTATGGQFAPQEAALTKRTSVGNYLRASGRNLGLDVRSYSGSASRPTPLTPWVATMGRAAMQGDTFAFDSAYETAIRVAMGDDGNITREEAKKRVRSAFASRHPLRSVFKTSPTESQYRQILASLGGDAAWVGNTIDEYNRYLRRLGLQAFDGTATHRPTTAAGLRKQLLKDLGITDRTQARRMTAAMLAEGE